nr:retrotransposon protein, putative, Ty1-copia subclass [Tanacetum cinerariifolium]
MTNADKTTALKRDVYKKAHSVLLLCLDNKMLREVNKEYYAVGVWLKLETLYMTKSLANKFYLKKKLFTFYMDSGKKLSEHIDKFNKLIGDLANTDVDIDDEDQALMLLTLNSRELKKKTDAKDDGDGLYVRGRSDHWGNQGRDCPKRNKKKSSGFVKKNAGHGSSMHYKAYDNGDLLMAEFNGGMVFLDDNRACAIMGIGKVWHKRLGHISEAGLHELEKREAIRNKGLGKLEFCKKYVLGKSTRVSFGRGQHTTKGVMDYVHTNLWGPSRMEPMSDYWYFLLIFNDYSRRVWVHFLRHKNEAFRKLKEWKQLVENQTDSFWAEATVTEAYLINRSPSTTLEKKKPMDLWNGHSKNNEMLRIFGCVAYSHVNQGKLKPRAIKCIFQRYPDGVKGYRLWRLDDVKPKIIIRRDVVFNESLMYMDTFKGAGAADSGKKVKFEVELQGSRVEPTVDPHTGENLRNEDEEQNEEPQQQNLDNYVLVHERAKRTTSIPIRYRDEGNVLLFRPSGSKVDDMVAYAFAIAEEEDTREPITFQEVINSSEKDKWVCAMEEEMSSLKKNHTWELVNQPRAWGFTQQAGIDYNEVFSHVVRHKSIRVILSLTDCKDYELEQLDVKTAFLHGNLKETIYMRQPPGFEEETANKVCLLKKSPYGLKQSPRQWYKRFDVYMITNGFSRNNYDSCVYFKEFAPDRKILGMEIVRDRGSRTLKVSQSGYVQKIMNNYRVDNSKSVSMPLGAHFKVSLKDCLSNDWDVEIISKVSYANAVGSLIYLMACTRPDIVYVVSIVSSDQRKHVDVDGFVDADYAKDPDKGRSITGYVFMVHGCVESWKATLQHVVALSITEAEYMALTEAVMESIWLKGLLIELGVNLRSVVVNCDNQSAIHLSRNAMFHERTKHINVRYHFIREIMEFKEIKVAKIGMKDNAADTFTKVVPGPKFKYCIEILGVGIK